MKTRCALIQAFLLGVLLLAVPSAVQAQYNFTTNTDGSLNISGYNGSDSVLMIPSVTNSLSITSIGNSVFYGCTNLTSVFIPNSFISIGDSVFYGCTSLTNVTMANSITGIGNSAFWGCTGLIYLVFPTTVTNIGSYACQDCYNLTSVYFIRNAPDADSTVFAGDTNAIVYYQSQTSGWGSSFGGAPALLQPYGYSKKNGAITIIGLSTNIGSTMVIPNTLLGLPVTQIGSYAFLANTNLNSVIIPNSVTNIGYEAFDNCSALTNVTFGTNVTYIGIYAFLYAA